MNLKEYVNKCNTPFKGIRHICPRGWCWSSNILRVGSGSSVGFGFSCNFTHPIKLKRYSKYFCRMHKCWALFPWRSTFSKTVSQICQGENHIFLMSPSTSWIFRHSKRRCQVQNLYFLHTVGIVTFGKKKLKVGISGSLFLCYCWEEGSFSWCFVDFQDEALKPSHLFCLEVCCRLHSSKPGATRVGGWSVACTVAVLGKKKNLMVLHREDGSILKEICWITWMRHRDERSLIKLKIDTGFVSFPEWQWKFSLSS